MIIVFTHQAHTVHDALSRNLDSSINIFNLNNYMICSLINIISCKQLCSNISEKMPNIND